MQLRCFRNNNLNHFLKIAVPCCLLPTLVFILLERRRAAQASKDMTAIVKLFSCRNYQSDGVDGELEIRDSLTETGDSILDSTGGKIWKPRDCLMQTYFPSSPLISNCFTKLPISSGRTRNEIVMIGDSRLRQLQQKLFWLITGKEPDERMPCDPPSRPDEEDWRRGQCNLTQNVARHALSLTRWWDTAVTSHLTLFLLNEILQREKRRLPNLVIINSGAWLLKNCYDTGTSFENCAKEYSNVIVAIRPLLERLSTLTRVLWLPQTTVDRKFSTLLLRSSQNEAVPLFNQIASCLLSGTKVKFWWSSEQIYDFFGDTHDGLHQGPKTLFFHGQIVMNLLCNAAIGSNSSYCRA